MKLIALIIMLLVIPQVNAWKWDTHQNIIEYVYLNLPIEVQQQLNLTKLKEGAIIPDRDFKDNRLHHYPKSLSEAEKNRGLVNRKQTKIDRKRRVIKCWRENFNYNKR